MLLRQLGDELRLRLEAAGQDDHGGLAVLLHQVGGHLRRVGPVDLHALVLQDRGKGRVSVKVGAVQAVGLGVVAVQQLHACRSDDAGQGQHYPELPPGQD